MREATMHKAKQRKPAGKESNQRPRQGQRGTEWGGPDKAETQPHTPEAEAEAKAADTDCGRTEKA